MLRNFLILAYRNFKRSPLTSFIELFGMTAGLTIFLLILLWVFNEFGYDKFNKQSNQIYRLEWSAPNKERSAQISIKTPPILKENLPEVLNTVRFRLRDPMHQIYTINEQGVKSYFSAGNRMNADQSMFDVFSFEFLEGNPATALSEINTVIITESLAKSIFGTASAIGKLVYFDTDVGLTVTAVIKDAPNFHIPFKMLYNYNEMDKIADSFEEEVPKWGHGFFKQATYLLAPPKEDVAQLERKIGTLIASYSPEAHKIKYPQITFHLRSLNDIYFNGGAAEENGYCLHGDRKKVVAYSSIAIFALLLACINFINLNSAKSLERAREVGIKKVVGATRFSIFIQFLGEVIILCNVALLLALICTAAFLPRFNDLLDTSLSLGQLLHPLTFAAMVVGLLLISLLSGGVPALYMASFKPVSVIKGLPVNSSKGISFRHINLVIQFSLTIILLISSITVFRQIHYMKHAELGFDKAHRVEFPFQSRGNQELVNTFKRTLLSNPNILHVAYSNAVPGRNFLTDQTSLIEFNGMDYEVIPTPVDPDYLNTLNLELVDGRFFDNNRAHDFFDITDSTRTDINVVLNETAVKRMNLKTPIGASGKYEDFTWHVIGVIKDYHVNSLNTPIDPMILIWNNVNSQMIAQISATNVPATIQFIENKFENIMGKKPELAFLEDTFDKQYKKDENFANLVGYFTILSILIACIGLFGVATYSIKLRLKEIGIRKTIGASSFQILKLITIYFIKILVLSAIIAVPISWLAMDSWLSNYPYRSELTVWVFVIGGSLTIAIALLTILWKSWKASNINPVKLIKYE